MSFLCTPECHSSLCFGVHTSSKVHLLGLPAKLMWIRPRVYKMTRLERLSYIKGIIMHEACVPSKINGHHRNVEPHSGSGLTHSLEIIDGTRSLLEWITGFCWCSSSKLSSSMIDGFLPISRIKIQQRMNLLNMLKTPNCQKSGWKTTHHGWMMLYSGAYLFLNFCFPLFCLCTKKRTTVLIHIYQC